MILTDKEKVKQILNFDNGGVYILLAIARKKDNEGITNSQEIVMREIVTALDKFDKKYERLVRQIEGYPNYNFKLYLTFNPKDPLKAYPKLKQRFAEWDKEMLNSALKGDKKSHNRLMNRVSNIQYEWISCLQKSPCKKEWFMLDLDDKSKIDKVKWRISCCNVGKHPVKLKHEFETQNGYHLLFNPGDTRILMENLKKDKIDCELKRDDLLCIGYYENDG